MLPNFKNKHIEKALYNPIDFIAYKKFKFVGKIPDKIIIFYNDDLLKYLKKNYKLKKVKIYSLLTIYSYKNIGFVKITGVGSPFAAGILEELIALGCKTFLNIGTAGGLHHEGIFVCTKALRDEGTSYHYISKGNFTFPNKELTKKLENSIKKEKLDYFKGATWTIDAIYRETKAEVERYSKKGIFTVEMEASALFAVAKYRKVKIASAFVVSDFLGKKWFPKFYRFDVRISLNKLMNAAIECFRN
jgi:uridine phosphorylase